MLRFEVIPHKEHNYDTLLITNYAYSDYGMTVLIDTGAAVPVWIKGEKLFVKEFPNSTKENTQTIIKGFGHGYELAPVYNVPEFVLMDSDHNSITILNLAVAIQEKRDFSFNMLLAYTSLQKMKYGHLPARVDKNGNSKKPEFVIKNDRQTYGMGRRYLDDDEITVFEAIYPGIRAKLKGSKLLNNVYTFSSSQLT